MAKGVVITHISDVGKNRYSFSDRRKQIEYEKKIELMKRRRRSLYPRFAQLHMRKDVIKLLSDLASKSGKAQALLTVLVYMADKYNAVICSYETLMERTGHSRATVARSIRILVEFGAIAILHTGRANCYYINDNLYWKSSKNNVKHCMFDEITYTAQFTKEERERSLKNIESMYERFSIHSSDNDSYNTPELPDSEMRPIANTN